MKTPNASLLLSAGADRRSYSEPAALVDLAPAAREVIAQLFQAVLSSQISCADTRLSRLEHKPLLAVEPLGLFDLSAMLLQQFVAFFDIEVLMVDAAIQVERDPAHVQVRILFVQQFFPRDIV